MNVDNQNVWLVIGQAVSFFFIFYYVPMSIYFTQRQWFLYKRFMVRNAATSEARSAAMKSYTKSKVRFALLYWTTVALTFLYSVFYGVYLYYALLVSPCKNDIGECPGLRWVALTILIIQSIIYLNYVICCVLLLISMKRIHSTI